MPRPRLTDAAGSSPAPPLEGIIDEGPADPIRRYRVDYEPYRARLRQSYAEGVPLSALVPDQAVGAFRSRMQTAAELEGLGVSIVERPAERRGMTRLVYQAKRRLVRSPESRAKQGATRKAAAPVPARRRQRRA